MPLAAGVLAPLGIVLAPAVGAILMSTSTIVVALQLAAAPPARSQAEDGVGAGRRAHGRRSGRRRPGAPGRIYGEQRLGPSGVDTTFAGTLRLPGDVVAAFHSSMDLPSRQELEVFGSDGTLLVQAPWRIDFGGDVLLRRGGEVGPGGAGGQREPARARRPGRRGAR